MNLFDSEAEAGSFDCKISVKSQGSNIISNKEYFMQFRPYLKEMLRALRPFFELIVYTAKPKIEAESIINEIEKEDSFFTYIIPVNYCYLLPTEKVHVKDINIFLGNRTDRDFVMVTTQPFDCMLNSNNGIPIVPFIGDE